MRQTNQRWQTATLLKKSKNYSISARFFNDFAQSGILYTEWVVRDKFRKSKMGMATILIKKILNPNSGSRFTDFNKIRQSDTY